MARPKHIHEADDDCTCTAREPRADDIEPPEVRVSRGCPVHGDLAHTDPDAARERAREV